MLKIVEKLFYESKWGIAYRMCSNTNNDIRDILENHMYTVVEYTDNHYWGADPFLIKVQDEIYLFCELMDIKKSRGMIGCCKISASNNAPKIKFLMDLGCHASYPCVFEYNSVVYMIPETSARHTVELYKAIQFPHKWEKVGNLLEKFDSVDSTVYMIAGIPYLFLYTQDDEHNKRILCFGKINIKTCSVEDLTTLYTYDSKIGRSAGNMFADEHNRVIRPTQFGVNYYGEKIIFNEITNLFSDYRETTVGELNIDSIKINKNYKILGVHTFNRLDKLEIIDFHYKQFDLFRPLRILLKFLQIGGYRFER